MSRSVAPAPGTPLPAALVAWIGEQRWFGDRGRRVQGATVAHAEAVADDLVWALAQLVFEDGSTASYQLFLPLPLPLDVGTEQADEFDGADRTEAARWLFHELLAGCGPVRLLGGEQSNTSLLVPTADGEVIVKLFRRVGVEANPDVETVRRLWEAGYRQVPEPLAECRRFDRDLAVARRFLRGSTSGWDLATDATATDAATDPDRFVADIRSLGRVTAELHLALATAFGSTTADPSGWAADFLRQLDRVDLGADRARAAARYEAFAALDPARAGRAIRIHGDYHLGQVLRWRDGWYVLDFEGEPARPVVERTAPSSPLRDVAGMLRSFGYAAAVGSWAPGREAVVRAAFLGGYLDTGIDHLLPADAPLVLDGFELDKAVYEVAYERAHRPDWTSIPLAAVARLLG